MSVLQVPSEMAFVACLLLAAVALGYQYVTQRGDPGPVRPSRLAVFAAPVFIALGGYLVVANAQPSGSIRLSLEALHFTRTAERAVSFSVGGDYLFDELVVARRGDQDTVRIAAGLVGVQQQDDGRVTLRVAEPTAAVSLPAVVQIDDRIIGATPVGPETALCFEACTGESARWIRYDAGRNALAAEGAEGAVGLVMRRRDADIPGLRLRDYGPRARIYPLRHYLPTANNDQPESGEAVTGGGLDSFFYRSPDGGLFFVNLDREVVLRGAEAPADEPAPAAVLCPAGDGCASAARVRVFEVRIASMPAATDDDVSSGMLRELRSFVVSAQTDSVLLTLDTPSSVVLTRSAIDQEAGRLADNRLRTELLLRAGFGRPSADQARSTVYLAVLGGDFLGAIDQRLLPRRAESAAAADAALEAADEADGGPACPGPDTPSQVAVADGNVLCAVANGRTVQLGQDSAVRMRIDQLDRSWPPLQAAPWLIVVGALVSFLATWPARSQSATHFAIFTIVDVMLLMRVLIALSAAHIDAGLDARGGVPDAFAIFLTVPLLLSLVLGVTYQSPVRLVGLVGHAVFVVAGVYWIDTVAGPIGFGGLLALLSAGVALLAAAAAWIAPRFGLRLSWPTWGQAAERGFFNPSVWLCIAFIIFLARVALAAVGVREAVMLGGQRVSLSIVYVPLVIAMFAFIFRHLALERRNEGQSPSLIFLVGFALLCVAPLAVARDTGAIIYALPIAILAHILALTGLEGEQGRRRWISLGLVYLCCGLGMAALTVLATAPPAASFLSYLRANLWALFGLIGASVLFVHALTYRKKSLLAAPAACLVWILVLVNVAQILPSATESRIEAVAATESTDDDLALLDSARQYAANNLRILGLIDRDALSEIGTRESEGQSIAFAHMADHSRALWGPGLLEAPAPSGAGLLRYHMNDNVTAVHVMGSFGRMGAIAYLALLFAALALAAATAPKVAGGEDGPNRAAYAVTLAAGTLVLVTAYMFLANIGAAPFTGRNAYLMAVSSLGDVAEAGVLFVLAILFSTGVQSDDE